MGLFGRGAPRARVEEHQVGSLDPSDHQMALLEITDAIAAHDAPALARLTAAERAQQLIARQALHHYLDALWQAPKLRAAREGRDMDRAHPTHDPAFSCVAGLLDLMAAMVAEVQMAQDAAGDDVDELQEPEYLPFDRFEAGPPEEL